MRVLESLLCLNVCDIVQFYSYEERMSHCIHPVAKRLLSIMAEKHSNLAFSADVTSSKELLKVRVTSLEQVVSTVDLILSKHLSECLHNSLVLN